MPAGHPSPASGDGYGDVDLYRETAARVAAGDNYYAAAIDAQLRHGYPTSPFMVVRLPTLTFVEAALGQVGTTVALIALAVLALLAMAVRIDRAGVGRAEWLAAVGLLGANLALCALGPLAWFHDAWAGVLIVLAIALRSDRLWWASVGAGFAAVCVRELALPFLLVMVVLSWPRRREALAWCGAVAAFACVYVLHALAVQAAQPANPAASNGWVGLGGWPFILASVATSSVLAVVPAVVGAILVPLALFGWLFAPAALRAAPLACAAFIACFMVVGRADNTYWGLLYTALLLTGLAFAPRGLVATVRAAIQPSADARPTARR
jgi:hypothetical protein